MEICNFCGIGIYPGHGSMFVTNKFDKFYFCSTKCKKLKKIGKTNKGLKWTIKFSKLNKFNEISNQIKKIKLNKTEKNITYAYFSTILFKKKIDRYKSIKTKKLHLK
ncbi:60S ribosomal protein L24 [Guillardia theta]|uniref:60S ribosomal protein L24 n=1 Tax=Guillardia theta TaxID=55529 RepID=Q9AVV9_GUITH|nr:60S ribosomal protein L24 [Guillardia theta]CAC27112.1 60S ribosomal protein L24 [Guillardia theta]|mmetsp:Transcript_20159/g.67405  ORF Transcript_20159/g.67405 Transcript_20159/m.67405 type:complete len:107 (+) Transcript_20159:2370-2690(+)